jgi:negative regulator of sigma E activity
MNTPTDCRAFDEALTDLPPAAAGSVELPLAARAHLGRCPACAVLWRRHAAVREVLHTLSPMRAPADLDGRVVAALEAGYREDRIVARLRTMAPLRAPTELDRRVRALFSPNPAPEVLDRLVEARLEGERRAALRRRVGWRLVQGAGLAAAAVVATLLLREPPTQRGGYDFEIVRLESLRDAGLDDASRGLIDGLTGGIVEAARN